MPLVCLSNGAYLPFGIECGACNNAYMILEFQKTEKQKAAKRNVDYFQRIWDAKLMHGSNLEMVRCCEGIEALSGKV